MFPRHFQRQRSLTTMAGTVCLLVLALQPVRLCAAQGGQDERLAAAHRLFNEALQLLRAGTKESLRQATGKFSEAASLFEAGGDRADEANSLGYAGFIYDNLGEKQKALDCYSRALPLRRALGDRSGEAITLGNIGKVYAGRGAPREALDYYARALPLFRAAGNRGGEAAALNNIGRVYADLGEPQKALDYYSQALPIRRAVGDRSGEASTLNNIGAVYNGLGEKQKALDYFSQALPLARAVANRGGEAVTLSNIGAIYDDLGEKQKALDCYSQALRLQQVIGDGGGEAITLNNIGRLNDDLGEKQKALDYFSQALSLSRSTGDRSAEAVALGNVGVVYASLGEKQEALDYHSQSLRLHRAIGDRHGEASALNNIGRLYDDLGERQKALDYFSQALPLYRDLGDRRDVAVTLSNLGAVYDNLGEKEKALEYYAQALPLHRAVGNRGGELATLDSVGKVFVDLGDYQKALGFFQQALSLARAIGSRNGEAATLDNIGVVYGFLGERQKALDYFQQALPLTRAVGNRGGEAAILSSMGSNYAALGDRPKALDYYAQALALDRAVGARSGEALTLYEIAASERDAGQLDEALAHIEACLSILESLRTKIGSQELRSSYFASVQGYYEFYIDLLMRLHKRNPAAGYDGKALQGVERARARSLLETLSEAGANIRQGVDPALLERERDLQQRLNAEAREQVKLVSAGHSDEQAAAVIREIEALNTEFQQVEARIRQTSPRYAALTQPQPLSLQEIQRQALDGDTILLEYSLGRDRSYLWAVTPDSINSYELPPRAEIEDAARQVYALLTEATEWARSAAGEQRGLGLAQPQAERGLAAGGQQGSSPEAALRLSRMVLSAAAAQLGKKRLVIVADGALQFIPFGALPTPVPAETAGAYRPLVLDHELISLPSVSTLAVLRREVKDRRPAAKALAVLADPVFDSSDERLRNVTAKGAAGNPEPARARGLGLSIEQMKKAARQAGALRNGLYIPRLPGTRREAEAIIHLMPAGESKEALDFGASRLTATSGELGQYRYVHFATHGFLDSQQPELSGLLLSMVDERGQPQDGFLRAHEIFNLKLAAEMVALSACETGLGKEVRGEGLIGLTRGFMYAGAPRVVVSLWSVSDAATAELMTRFYRGILVDKLRPAQALQAAQVSLLKDTRYAAPFYWAAFTLQGEWK